MNASSSYFTSELDKRWLWHDRLRSLVLLGQSNTVCKECIVAGCRTLCRLQSLRTHRSVFGYSSGVCVCVEQKIETDESVQKEDVAQEASSGDELEDAARRFTTAISLRTCEYSPYHSAPVSTHLRVSAKSKRTRKRSPWLRATMTQLLS